MNELFHNFQPTLYALVGIIALAFSYPRNIQKWKAQPPHRPDHWTLRIIFGLGILLSLSFAISFLLAPTTKLVWINTLCAFAISASYLAKVLLDMRRYIED